MLTSVAVAMGTMDLTVVTIAAPAIASSLHSTLMGLQWLTNGYSLTFAALLLPSGSLSDRFDQMAVFVTGVIVFTAGSADCLVAPVSALLIAGRVVQGAGAALVLSSALALISSAYPQGRPRQAAIAVYSAVSAVAAASAPLLGGIIVQQLGWRWIFGVNVPVGLAVVLAARRSARQRRAGRQAQPLDVTGFVLATAGLMLVNVGLLQGPANGWTSPGVIASMAGGWASLTFFVVHQARHRDGLIDISVFRSATFSGMALVSVLARFSSFGVVLFMALYLEGALRYSPFQASLRLAIMPSTFVIATALTSRLRASMRRPDLVIAAGLALSGAGLAWSSAVTAGSPWTVLVPAMALSGIGGGLYFPLLLGTAIDEVRAERRGMAAGIVNACLPLGTALGVAVLGGVTNLYVAHSLPPALAAEASQVAAGQLSSLARFGVRAVAAARTASAAGLSAVLVTASLAAAAAAILALVTRHRLSWKEPSDAGDHGRYRRLHHGDGLQHPKR